MDVFGSLRKLTKIVFPTNSGAKNVELQASNQTGASPVVFSLPDAGDSTGTLVELNASQTLTGKTIDGDDNTVQDLPVTAIKTVLADANKALVRDASGIPTSALIVNANVDAAAALARSKLASGTASHVIINDGSGVLSSEAQLATSRGGTGVNSTATFPSSGVVVTRTASESLTNKTLDDTSNVLLKGGNTTGATVRVGSNDSNSVVVEANNADRITARVAAATNADVKLHGTAGVELPTGTAAQRPSSPVNGTIRHNTDTNEFEGYSAGAWQAVGGGVNERPLTNYLKAFATATVTPSFGTDLTWNSTVTSETSITVPATTWRKSTAASALTLTLDTSTSTRLRGGSCFVTGGGFGANTDGSRFFQSPPFQLDIADRGKPISVSFDLSGSGSSTDWDVVAVRYSNAGAPLERIPVAGVASDAASTPSSARLPTGTAQFSGFFVSAADDSYYVLRFRRLANATDIRLDTLYVGPQAQLVGAPVTDWISGGTLTVTGSVSNPTKGTISVDSLFWRRVGDSMELYGQYQQTVAGTAGSGIYLVALPSGFTIDSAKLSGVGSGGATQNLGTIAVTNGTGATTYYNAYASSTSLIAFNGFQAGGSPADFATTALRFSFSIRVPIANWSSNATMANRAVEEYVFNTAATTAAGGSDTTSFGYGAAGTLFNSFDSTTAASATTLRCRFQTPIQQTDKIFIEFLRDSSSAWQEVAVNNVSIAPYQSQNDSFYGTGWVRVSGSTTDIDIVFGNKGRTPSTSAAAGFGANGVAWSGATSWRWRVRKVSGGASVGFPVGARNVVGDTTGVAVPVGNIGERFPVTETGFSGVTAGATTAYTQLASLALTPGVWMLYGHAELQAATGTTWTSGDNQKAAIGTTTASASGAVQGSSIVESANAGTVFQNTSVVAGLKPLRYVNISASTTYYLNGAATYGGTAPSWRGSLFAVRIG
jgi:hypothetical protein